MLVYPFITIIGRTPECEQASWFRYEKTTVKEAKEQFVRDLYNELDQDPNIMRGHFECAVYFDAVVTSDHRFAVSPPSPSWA
jgi:hypothetical protein